MQIQIGYRIWMNDGIENVKFFEFGNYEKINGGNNIVDT